MTNIIKLYPTLVKGVVASLREIFQEGRYADKVIQTKLKSNPKWGSRDRAFIAENVYDMVRWWRLFRKIDGRRWENEGKGSDSDLVRLLGINLILKNHELPDWEEFKELSKKSIFQQKQKLETERKIFQSIPDWLDEMAHKEIGDRWDKEIKALNQTAEVVLRVNTLKTTKRDLKRLLLKEGWDTTNTPLSPTALVLKRRGNLFSNTLFKKGMFEIQDAGSQCIAPFLQVEPGMRVVDACAGVGGKSLHLAALMQNKGSIISLDPKPRKLSELKKRARRNGVDIIQTQTIEANKTIKQLRNSADRLLLDAPCSGLGVLRRNPDTKWKLSPEFMEKVKAIQSRILENYSPILVPGGQMVYATCSILPSENEWQVEQFLAKHKNFALIEERKISPSNDGFDGYYMARIVMNDE